MDGALILLEAKDSPRQFTPKSHQKILGVARAYLPDSVVIACMSEPAKMRPKVEQLRSDLESNAIEVELLSLDEQSWNEPSFYLPR